MSQQDGGPAFPGMWQDPHSGTWLWKDGMALHQWYVGMALQGMLAANEQGDSPEDLAQRCYEIADALLAQRKGKGT